MKVRDSIIKQPMRIFIAYKMEIPQELYSHEIIRYLPVQDILKLCQTNISLSKICQENTTWQFLIGRDFGIEYEGENAIEQYWEILWIRDHSRISIEKLPIVDDEYLNHLGFYRDGDSFVWLEPDFESFIEGFFYTGSPLYEITFDAEVDPFYLILFPEGVITFGEVVRIYDYYHGKGSGWRKIKEISEQELGLTHYEIAKLRDAIFTVPGE